MTVFLLTLLYFSLNAALIFGNDADYYWREYRNVVPADALIGGLDVNGENVYIGQAYIHAEGLIVVQIKAGAKEVNAPIKGVKNVSRYIKILCGRQENFSWLPTNSTNIHVDLLNKSAVIGGHEDGLGSSNIGRISYEGGAQIGKINSFSVGNAQFRWADIYNKEPVVSSYEVLIYQRQNQCVSIF